MCVDEHWWMMNWWLIIDHTPVYILYVTTCNYIYTSISPRLANIVMSVENILNSCELQWEFLRTAFDCEMADFLAKLKLETSWRFVVPRRPKRQKATNQAFFMLRKVACYCFRVEGLSKPEKYEYIRKLQENHSLPASFSFSMSHSSSFLL